jgi:6-methylsalicylate decarboxylase
MGVTDTDQQLIDVHAHFLTDAYVVAARAAGHIHPDGMAGWPSWSAEEHLRLMDRWGVATAMHPDTGINSIRAVLLLDMP